MPGLTGEPEDAVAVERGGIEVRVRVGSRQLEHLDLLGRRVHPHDRVQAAVGDPRCAVGTDDHAVRRGARAEVDLADLPGRRVEMAERAVVLARVPDATVDGGRDVVWMAARRDRVLDELPRRVARSRSGRGEAVASGAAGGGRRVGSRNRPERRRLGRAAAARDDREQRHGNNARAACRLHVAASSRARRRSVPSAARTARHDQPPSSCHVTVSAAPQAQPPARIRGAPGAALRGRGSGRRARWPAPPRRTSPRRPRCSRGRADPAPAAGPRSSPHSALGGRIERHPRQLELGASVHPQERMSRTRAGSASASPVCRAAPSRSGRPQPPRPPRGTSTRGGTTPVGSR